jgi:hypothetical protein
MSGGVLTHYISLDTELYFWDYLTGADAASEQRKNNFRSMIAAQWHWLVADLKRAAESGKYAWIIAYGHRPLYCSNVDDIPDCTVDAETLRKGPGGMYGFEAAFASVPGALDIYFAAHEHSSVDVPTRGIRAPTFALSPSMCVHSFLLLTLAPTCSILPLFAQCSLVLHVVFSDMSAPTPCSTV